MANPGAATTTTVHPQVLSSNQAIRLIAYATSVSVNATGDAAITLPVINTTTYNVTNVVITNANKNVATAALAIWTGASGTGTEIVTNAALTNNTSSAFVTKSTVVAATGTANISAQVFYVNIGTAVAGGTVDVYVYGTDFTAF
jgi:hypothetical protein